MEWADDIDSHLQYHEAGFQLFRVDQRSGAYGLEGTVRARFRRTSRLRFLKVREVGHERIGA